NALAVRADFGPVYMDYYLHLMQHSLRPDSNLDKTFKEALAALTLHLVSRPWREVTAWTVNFQSPPFNLFVTGDNFRESVTGRVFTEDVKEGEKGLFYAQVTEVNQPVRQSVVE